MRKRYLTLHCTQEEVERQLKQFLRLSAPKGTVEDHHFKLFMKTSSIFYSKGLANHIYNFYVFSGAYQQSGKDILVAYCIRPAFSWCVTLLVLAIAILYQIYQAFFVNVPDFSFIVILGVCALVYLLIFYDIKKCITMFEQQLTKKV